MRFGKQVMLRSRPGLAGGGTAFGADGDQPADRHREGRAGRGAARRDGHRDVTGPHRLAGGGDGSQRAATSSRRCRRARYTLKFELSGFKAVHPAEHHAGAGPDAERRRRAAAGVAAGDRAGDGRVADRRHAVDVGGQHDGHGEADRRAELDRPVGRAGAVAGRPDAGLRRRRQPQEPAVGLRRRSASRARRASSPRAWTRPRGRAAPGFYQDYYSQNEIAVSGGGPGRVDEHAGRGRHLDHQERRQPVQVADQPDLRGQELRGQQREQRRSPRAAARRSRTCCSGRTTTTWAARSSRTSSGSSWRTTTSTSTRQISGVPIRTSRPTWGSSTTSRRRRPGSRRRRTRWSATTSGGRSRSRLRGLSATRGRRTRRWRSPARAGCTTASGSASGRTGCSPS